MNQGIRTVIYTVKDIAQAKTLYSKLLGVEPSMDEAYYVGFRVGDQEVIGFENVAKYVTPDLAYILEVERIKAKLCGREDVAPLALRTTSILRPEDGTWKVVHRHADPITTVQAPESVIQK